MAADEAYERQLLELLISDEALDAINQEVVVQYEQDRKEVQQAGHRKFIVQIEGS